LHKRQVSQNLIEQVAQLEAAEMLDEEGFEQAIGEQLGALSEQHKKLIKDGARVAAYQAQAKAPVVKLLVCDDAGQSKAITEEVALCWVHDGRHYKKLMPVCEPHQKLLVEFRGASAGEEKSCEFRSADSGGSPRLGHRYDHCRNS
jgi:hypothetical protein